MLSWKVAKVVSLPPTERDQRATLSTQRGRFALCAKETRPACQTIRSAYVHKTTHTRRARNTSCTSAMLVSITLKNTIRSQCKASHALVRYTTETRLARDAVQRSRRALCTTETRQACQTIRSAYVHKTTHTRRARNTSCASAMLVSITLKNTIRSQCKASHALVRYITETRPARMRSRHGAPKSA